MKRTNRVTKFISVVLFLFLVVYFGASLIRSAQNPLRTTIAITMTTEEGFIAPGIIIRDESIISVTHPVVTSLVREGERVSVGMRYLLVYANEGDRELAMRRTQLESEIAQLEERLSLDSGTHQSGGVEAEIRTELRYLSLSVRQGDLSDLEAQTIALRTLSIAGDRTGLQGRLETLRGDLDRLGNLSAPVRSIEAEQAGMYSIRVDGFEYLDRAALTEFTVPAMQELLDRRYSPADISEGAGKLVRGSTWYYAALIPEAEFEMLHRRFIGELPNRVFLSVSGMRTSEISMRIHSLGEVQNGQAVAVFSSNIALIETLGIRHAEARIVHNTFTGLRVPAEALHWTEPNDADVQFSYVFTLTVGMAEQKFVTVIYTGADYYLVRPNTERTSVEASLREGNTLILRGGTLYDGRIFR